MTATKSPQIAAAALRLCSDAATFILIGHSMLIDSAKQCSKLTAVPRKNRRNLLAFGHCLLRKHAYTAGSFFPKSRGGEIGRRARLRIWWSNP